MIPALSYFLWIGVLSGSEWACNLLVAEFQSAAQICFRGFPVWQNWRIARRFILSFGG
jgi:hypothetical protein